MDALENRELIKRKIKQGTRKIGECHIWQRHETLKGYGYLGISGCIFAVRRLSWWLHHGYLPEGRCLKDTCGNKLCHNPDHLRDFTPAKERRTTLLREGSEKSRPAFSPKEDLEIWDMVELGGLSVYAVAKLKGTSWKSTSRALARAKQTISGM